jgi:hypothetical protein
MKLTKNSTQSELLAYIKENLTEDKNLSIRGVAALCGVHHTAIIRGADLKSQKLAEKLTAYGFKGDALSENGFPAKAVWLVIEYFAYESKAQAENAKTLARTFGQFGIMQTFDKLTEEPPKTQLKPSHDKAEITKLIIELEATQLPATVKQILTDSLVNEYITDNKLITTSTDRWMGAVQRAEQLGYSTNLSSRTKLGQYISLRSDGLTRKREERLCNSVTTPIWVYLVNDALDDKIHSFFS